MDNIKKRAKSIVDALKRSNGRNSLEVKVAEMAKRALMMLPLLPIEFITAEVVNFVIWRWGNAFPKERTLTICSHTSSATTFDQMHGLYQRSGACVVV